MFWFLILILLNNFRDLFIFCINVDTDEIFLLEKNKGLWVNFFRVIFLFYSKKGILFMLLILINNFRDLFIFCINVDTDVMLQWRKIRV